MTARWTARAAHQLLDAVTYLEGERDGAGRALHEAVRSTLEVAREHPQRRERGSRRA